ncbi:LRR receptor-like serine threonine-protein kinase [Musa troglodytarum]|uniref:LRR receptor-like serine threonine-protein kinase n=1 Tax=Musa troglodytarum TaxID=320322 RepID=A0A9E7H2F6_9LILI|nr:LRR receptor-like serine threonine-protein kinase [Musa troglodytarum]
MPPSQVPSPIPLVASPVSLLSFSPAMPSPEIFLPRSGNSITSRSWTSHTTRSPGRSRHPSERSPTSCTSTSRPTSSPDRCRSHLAASGT